MISREAGAETYMSKRHQSLNYGTKTISLTHTREGNRKQDQCEKSLVQLRLLCPMAVTKIDYAL